MLPLDDSDLDPAVEATASLALTVAWAAGALVVAFAIATVLSVLIRRIGRRNPLMRDMAARMRRPMRVMLMILAIWLAVHFTADPDEPWFDVVSHLLLIATIIAAAWLVGSIAFVIEDRTLARFHGTRWDDQHARRVRTQVNLLRRITVAILVVCAIAAVLTTFPALRGMGSTILASAGVLSIVAGLAAQSSLANTFAGMQIAFTDAIRVDDVVVLNGEFGRIEEITLTYVVVHAWDDRRLILPCTYFTTTPFENWTRRAADLLGTVEIDLDFQVPMTPLRSELDRLLGSTSLWDERTGLLQVTDAVEGHVRVRALVSAADAPTLWDLRCYVREGLVEWLQREVPEALPRMRLDGPGQPSGPWLGTSSSAESGSESGSEPGADAGTDPGADVHPDRVAAPSSPPGVEPRTARKPGGRSEGKRPDKSAPAIVPARASVLRRELPSPVRSTVRPAERREARQDRTVVLGAVEHPETVGAAGPTDETVMMEPVEADTGEQVSTAERSAMYSGSAEAEARSAYFNGPGKDVIEEREQTALLQLGGEDPDEEQDEAHGDDADADERRRRRITPDSGEGGPTHGPGDGHGDGHGGRGDGGHDGGGHGDGQ